MLQRDSFWDWSTIGAAVQLVTGLGLVIWALVQLWR